jgi:poly(3-hydroxybutyrate) depolymerase
VTASGFGAVALGSALLCAACEGGSAKALARSESASPIGHGSAASPGATGAASPIPSTRLPSSKSKCPPDYQQSLEAGHHAHFQSAGQNRSFDVVLPPASFAGPRPLIFAFHGTGLSGGAVISGYGLQEWADDGFIVVAPDTNANGRIWPVWDGARYPSAAPAPNPDLMLFDDLIGCVAAHHEVDANRIYVTGQSAGGEMTNYVLGQRSKLLAGGVPESAAFDLTQPVPASAIDPMIVIVAWGGDNDIYTGSAGTASVSNIEYAEQSALASRYWETRPGGQQIHCKGNNLGHVWLPGMGAWMRAVLLAHPKGAADSKGWTMPPVPAGAPVTCSETAATYTPRVSVKCGSSKVAGCQAYCQLLGDCLVENGTIGPVAAPSLVAIGFAPGVNVCSGCVANCESEAGTSTSDTAALSCLSKGAATTTCGPGIAGAAAFATIGACCGANPRSKVCSRYCNAFKQSGGIIVTALTGCP